jgi:hypothetical protein
MSTILSDSSSEMAFVVALTTRAAGGSGGVLVAVGVEVGGVFGGRDASVDGEGRELVLVELVGWKRGFGKNGDVGAEPSLARC